MCSKYEDGLSYLKKDTSVVCWEYQHLLFAFSIGATFILMWAVIFPLAITYRLYKIRNKFKNEKNLKIYGIFYIGLNDDSYFWEILIVSLRKIFLIFCSTVFGTSN